MNDSSSVGGGQVGLEMKPMVYHQRPSQRQDNGGGDYSREQYDYYGENATWLAPSCPAPPQYDQHQLDNESRDYNSNDSRHHNAPTAPSSGQVVELDGCGATAWNSTGRQKRCCDSSPSSISDDGDAKSDRLCRGRTKSAAPPFRNSAGSETDNRSCRVSSADESVTSHDSAKSPSGGGGYWPGQGTETSLLLHGRPETGKKLAGYQDPASNPRTYTRL